MHAQGFSVLNRRQDSKTTAPVKRAAASPARRSTVDGSVPMTTIKAATVGSPPRASALASPVPFGPCALLVEPVSWVATEDGVMIYGYSSEGRTVAVKFAGDSRSIHEVWQQYELQPYHWLSIIDYEPLFEGPAQDNILAHNLLNLGVEELASLVIKPRQRCLMLYYYDNAAQTVYLMVHTLNKNSEHRFLITANDAPASLAAGVEILRDSEPLRHLRGLITFYRPDRCLTWGETGVQFPSVTALPHLEMINLQKASVRLGLKFDSSNVWASLTHLSGLWLGGKLEAWLLDRAAELRVSLPELIHHSDSELVKLMMASSYNTAPRLAVTEQLSTLKLMPLGRHRDIAVWDLANDYRTALLTSRSSRDKELELRSRYMPTSFLAALFASGYVSLSAQQILCTIINPQSSTVLAVSTTHIYRNGNNAMGPSPLAIYRIYDALAEGRFAAYDQRDRLKTNLPLADNARSQLSEYYSCLFRQVAYRRPPDLVPMLDKLCQ